MKIYEWPTRKNKIANAIVTGFIVKKIFIADHLVKNLTIEEIKAILSHEIGHVKKFHLGIRALFFLLFYPISTLSLDLIEKFHYIPSEPSFVAVFWMLIAMILYIVFYFGFVFMFICRIQERQADRYVIESGVNIRVYISALTKLAALNFSKKAINKVDEKFQTHPSIQRRIKWVEQYAADFLQGKTTKTM